MKTQKITKIVFCEDRAELIEQELPELGPDQILVKTSCSLISPGTERAALTRVWDDAWFRENPGYALAGEVCEVGKDVKNFSVGERVLTLKNHASLSITSSNPWDTLKIQEGVSDEESTFMVLASVALHGLRRAQISLGETLVIIGAGIIGQMAVQLAKLDGAKKVIVLDMVDSRLEQARRYGADLTLNPAREDAVAQVFAATRGKGASVILEATGNVKAIPQAFKMAAHGGRIICCGLMEETTPIPFNLEFLARELSLIAAHQPHCPTADHIYWQWTQQANRELLLEYLAGGKIHAAEMITHRFKAEDAPQVYQQIKDMDPRMLGVILDWG
jgi:2-desacetyl-2-hydroxyethyl bacteriochlorophyllide A dehydrogenase